MKRFFMVVTALCMTMALAILPASAEKVNLTERGVFKAAPGEIRMFEVGDITVDKKGGIWAESKSGHVIVNAGRISGGDCYIGLDAYGGSIVASIGDFVSVDGNIAQIRAKDRGFVRLVGGDCSTENGSQGFFINEEGSSEVGIRSGAVELKGKYGLICFLEDSSALTFSAARIKNDGEYGVFMQCNGKGDGDDTLVTLWADELEATGTAMDFQQYGSGYYSDFVFGKVTAGDIALRLSVDSGNVADILVKEDITSGRIGVRTFSDNQVKLIVLGTISAPEAPILAIDMSGRNGRGFGSETSVILAWRIIPTASGHVVLPEGKEKDHAEESDAAESMEKLIRYIIRTEESDKASFTLKKADGEDIRRSFGYPVACEGERVLVEVQAADGYRVTGAMNGEDEKIPLEQDENGSWYFDMPRGGGISLFAVTEPAT